jgi:hemoglobin/transferrin/lactoferrin receptor protein
VYGVEGDVDVGHIAGSQINSVGGTFGSAITVTPTGLTFIGSRTAPATENSEINWLSSIRGRVGFAVLDRLLLFATGGLAISEARSDGSVTVTNTDIISHTVAQQIIWSGSHSEVKAGFVVGGGAEWAFADR